MIFGPLLGRSRPDSHRPAARVLDTASNSAFTCCGRPPEPRPPPDSSRPVRHLAGGPARPARRRGPRPGHRSGAFGPCLSVSDERRPPHRPWAPRLRQQSPREVHHGVAGAEPLRSITRSPSEGEAAPVAGRRRHTEPHQPSYFSHLHGTDEPAATVTGTANEAAGHSSPTHPLTHEAGSCEGLRQRSPPSTPPSYPSQDSWPRCGTGSSAGSRPTISRPAIPLAHPGQDHRRPPSSSGAWLLAAP